MPSTHLNIIFQPFIVPLEKMHNRSKAPDDLGQPGTPLAKLMESLICLANKTDDFYTKSL